MVKNYMETLVESALQKELSDHAEKYPELCQCSTCLSSVMSFALNRLKPFYITCIAGEVFGEYHSKELQNLSDILVAVVSGISHVAAQPPHASEATA